MIAVRDLHLALTRDGVTRQVLQGVGLTLARGERLCIAGPSGVGKSTILRVLLGLLAPTAGEVTVDGRPLADWLRRDAPALRRLVQPVFQSPAAVLPPRQRIGATLREPLHIHRLASGAAADDAVAAMLLQLGLPAGVQARFPHQLSGGQQQRVVLGRALLLRPAWLLADEPTSALDPATALEMAALLRELSVQRGLGLLVVTHDPALPLHLDAPVRPLHAGRLGESVPPTAWLAQDRALWQGLRTGALD